MVAAGVRRDEQREDGEIESPRSGPHGCKV